MTRPIYEPSLTRADAELGYGRDQLFRRPAPKNDGSRPWVMLANGFTTAPDNTLMPIPFDEYDYDPALVTIGDIFDYDTTDTGDTGVWRFELKTRMEGFYGFHLRTEWDQINTNGTEDFAYYMQQVRIMNTSETTTFYENRASADWMRDDVDGGGGVSAAPGEQFENPYLNLSDVVYLAGTRIWKCRARQTTGVDRGLAGVQLFVYFFMPTDSSTWTFLTLAPGS